MRTFVSLKDTVRNESVYSLYREKLSSRKVLIDKILDFVAVTRCCKHQSQNDYMLSPVLHIWHSLELNNFQNFRRTQLILRFQVIINGKLKYIECDASTGQLILHHEQVNYMRCEVTKLLFNIDQFAETFSDFFNGSNEQRVVNRITTNSDVQQLLESAFFLSTFSGISIDKLCDVRFETLCRYCLRYTYLANGFNYSQRNVSNESKIDAQEFYENHGGHIYGPHARNNCSLYESTIVYDYDSMYACIAAAYNISSETCYIVNVDDNMELLENLKNLSISEHKNLFHFIQHDNVERYVVVCKTIPCGSFSVANRCLLNYKRNIAASTTLKNFCKRFATIWYGTICLRDKFLGADITQVGRNIIRKTVIEFEKQLFEGCVFYGDTDSVFVSFHATNVPSANGCRTINYVTNFVEKCTFEAEIVKCVFLNENIQFDFILRKEQVFSHLIICRAKRYIGLSEQSKSVIIKGIKTQKYASFEVYNAFVKAIILCKGNISEASRDCCFKAFDVHETFLKHRYAVTKDICQAYDLKLEKIIDYLRISNYVAKQNYCSLTTKKVVNFPKIDEHYDLRIDITENETCLNVYTVCVCQLSELCFIKELDALESSKNLAKSAKQVNCKTYTLKI
ncbi:hypothetical protein B4U80_13583 [Leptotrombidium deliense]|uniref:DNA-directed DNA polymerase n=1 Tax=Leptotrombidium deliense TaxID=299467 RepID=A0A443SWP6_9ACAR|nr:hypothetical protein B4U80_13583 [Leptotrombidium deliense]